jgi:hypothetical protein
VKQAEIDLSDYSQFYVHQEDNRNSLKVRLILRALDPKGAKYPAQIEITLTDTQVQLLREAIK